MQRWLSAVILLLLAIAAPARATTIIPADFTEMVAGSQLIVHGAVIDVRSQLTAGARRIESVITIAVASSLKGHSASTVVLRVPGGQVGRYRRVMVGAPEFVEGEEVVLFLTGHAPAMPMPFGLNQGVYRVVRRGGRALVTPLVASSAGRVVRGDPARRPVGFDDFAAQVRTLVERER
jgi:hypothetical protein